MVNGPMVRSMRLQAGLSHQQLAALLGVSRMRIYYLERQGWIRPETVLRLHAAIREGERRWPQWVKSYRRYYESLDEPEPPDFVTQRLLAARAKESARQRKYRAKRRAIALEVLGVIDGQIGALLFKLQRQFGQEAQATADKISLLRYVRKQQVHIFSRGHFWRDGVDHEPEQGRGLVALQGAGAERTGTRPLLLR